MKKKFAVLLESGTVGTLTAETAEVGMSVAVNFKDENGESRWEKGVVQEVLEETSF